MSPEQGQSGGETAKPEEGQSGGETAKPEEGQSGGETTKPEEGQSGGETTNPEQGQSGGETTNPEQGQSGGETTNPEQGQSGSGSSGSETPQVTKYTVSFDSDGGSAVSGQEIESGSTAEKPADPSKAGFVFKGWYLGDTKFEFTTPVTGALSLKAKWTESGIFSSEGAFFIYIDESADPSSLGTAW